MPGWEKSCRDSPALPSKGSARRTASSTATAFSSSLADSPACPPSSCSPPWATGTGASNPPLPRSRKSLLVTQIRCHIAVVCPLGRRVKTFFLPLGGDRCTDLQSSSRDKQTGVPRVAAEVRSERNEDRNRPLLHLSEQQRQGRESRDPHQEAPRH